MKRYFLIILFIPLLSACQKSPAAFDRTEVQQSTEVTREASSETSLGVIRENSPEISSAGEPVEEPDPVNTTSEEFSVFLSERLEKWMQQSELPVSRSSPEVYEDLLLMEETDNRKKVENVDVCVNIYLNLDEITEGLSLADRLLKEEELVSPLYPEISDIVRQSPFGRYRVQSLTISWLNDQNPAYQYGKRSISYAILVNPVSFNQSGEEYGAQTLAYQFALDFSKEVFHDEIYQTGSIRTVTLRRFGVLPDTQELYIEIPIYSANEDPAALKASLSGRAQELYEILTQDEKAWDYLQENSVSNITIAFYTPWDREAENRYNTYRYEF